MNFHGTSISLNSLRKRSVNVLNVNKPVVFSTKMDQIFGILLIYFEQYQKHINNYTLNETITFIIFMGETETQCGFLKYLVKIRLDTYLFYLSKKCVHPVALTYERTPHSATKFRPVTCTSNRRKISGSFFLSFSRNQVVICSKRSSIKIISFE